MLILGKSYIFIERKDKDAFIGLQEFVLDVITATKQNDKWIKILRYITCNNAH